MKQFYDRLLWPVFLVAMGLLIAAAAISYRNTARLVRDAERVTQTYQVVSTIQALQSDIREAESSQRGFYLSGDPATLEVYTRARGHLASSLKELRRLLADDISQQHRLAALVPVIDRRIKQFESAIRMKGENPNDFAQHGERVRLGASVTQDISAKLAEIEGEERRLLGLRTAQSHASSALAIKTTSVVAGIGASLLIGLLLVMRREIKTRRETEQELELRAQDLQNLYDEAPCGYHSLDAEGRFVRVNHTFSRWTGFSPRELLGKHFAEFLTPESREQFQESVPTLDEQGFLNGQELRLVRKGGGSTLPILTNSKTVIKSHDRGRFSRWTTFDVTERVEAEQTIRRSLHEKEMLLREIHHRVKNNLQIISSLLHFQAKKLAEPGALGVFNDARDRLRAMILVHEKLYNSKNLAEVDFADYAKALVEALGDSGAGRRIRFRVEADALLLPIEMALPAGMILAELVTNVLKYAFPEERRGEALVKLEAVEGGARLMVKDDGVGLPAGFDMNQTRSFGCQLIRSLTMQLDGQVSLESAGGTQVAISFPTARAA